MSKNASNYQVYKKHLAQHMDFIAVHFASLEIADEGDDYDDAKLAITEIERECGGAKKALEKLIGGNSHE
jgi:hypothetical protein